MPTSHHLSLRMESAVRPALPRPLGLPGTSWDPRVVALKLGGVGVGWGEGSSALPARFSVSANTRAEAFRLRLIRPRAALCSASGRTGQLLLIFRRPEVR